jgi:hypothetical protein
MTIRAAWKKKRQSQHTTLVTTTPAGGSQNQTHIESDIDTTVNNGSQHEQEATTVHPAHAPTSGRVGVIVELVQRIETDIAQLKRELQRLPWSQLDQ